MCQKPVKGGNTREQVKSIICSVKQSMNLKQMHNYQQEHQQCFKHSDEIEMDRTPPREKKDSRPAGD